MSSFDIKYSDKYIFADAMLTELMNGTEGSVGDLGPVGPKKNGQVRF